MKRKLLLISIGIVISTLGFSQTMTEVRQMRYEAIDIFDQYCTFILKLDNPDIYTKDYFTALFDEDAEIYNDILPANRPQYLTASEYYEQYTKLIKLYPQVSDLQLNFPYFENNKWWVKVRFKKTFALTYREQNLKYPEWSFNYEMLIAMDKNSAYQKGISSHDEENKPFNHSKIKSINVEESLVDYFIIQFDDSRMKDDWGGLYWRDLKVDNLTAAHNSMLFNAREYNRLDFGLHSSISDDYKMMTKPHPHDPHFWNYKVVPLKNIVGISLGYTPFGIIKSSPATENVNLHSQNLSLSLVYGRLLLKKNKARFYLQTKLGYSMDYMDFTGSHYTQYDAIDADNSAYLRKIKLSGIKERDKFHNIILPIGLGYTQDFNQSKFSLTADLGAWATYTFRNSKSSKSDVLYSGFYEQFYHVEITQNGYYDYGHFRLNAEEDKTLNTMDYGVYGALGVMYKLRFGFYAKADIAYYHGFCNKSEYTQNYQPSTHYENYTPFFYSLNNWNINDISINISLLKKI